MNPDTATYASAALSPASLLLRRPITRWNVASQKTEAMDLGVDKTS
jgi:hypothetical protein